MSKKLCGFTIIELMIVILIATVLMMMAIPSYQSFIKRHNIESLQSRFSAAVITARSEAASRNGNTAICASSDSQQCSGTWSDGWILFLDNGEGRGSAGDTLRHNDESLILAFSNTGNYLVNVFDESGKNSLSQLSFNTQGFTDNEQRALITICAPDKEATYTRGILLERSGRTMTTSDLEGSDGVHESRFDDGFGNVTTQRLSC